MNIYKNGFFENGNTKADKYKNAANAKKRYYCLKNSTLNLKKKKFYEMKLNEALPLVLLKLLALQPRSSVNGHKPQKDNVSPAFVNSICTQNGYFSFGFISIKYKCPRE